MPHIQQFNRETARSSEWQLATVMQSLGYVRLVPNAQHLLRLLDCPPVWCQEVFGIGSHNLISVPADVPVFDEFLEQCTDFWASKQREQEWLVSEIWEQPTETAPTLHLQALATVTDDQPLLLVKRLDLDTNGLIEKVRSVRRTMLSSDDYLALQQKLNVEMENAKCAAEQYAREKSVLLKRLEDKNRDLERFASIASHDLQEPLRKITSFGQMLKEETAGDLSADATTYLNYMTDGASRMSQLTKDLLTFSKTALGDCELKIIDPNLALQAAIDDLQMSIEESSAIIQSQTLPEVFADSFHLKAVFQNLISNAIKYTGSETPKIEIGSNKTDSEHEFYVKDNGIGIEERHFSKVFEIFQRLHNRSQYEGTGIGLATCDRIIAGLGGRFRLESELGIGSTFFFTIPIQKSSKS